MNVSADDNKTISAVELTITIDEHEEPNVPEESNIALVLLLILILLLLLILLILSKRQILKEEKNKK